MFSFFTARQEEKYLKVCCKMLKQKISRINSGFRTEGEHEEHEGDICIMDSLWMTSC